MILILLLASVVRMPQLASQSIAFDEGFSLVVGRATWPVMFQALLSDGVHPPLFYAIHKGALNLFGVSEFGQRFLMMVCSVLGVALVYRLGTLIVDRRVGVVGAVLLALNPLHIWLAQEARMYSLLIALTLLSMILFWQAIRTNRRSFWAGLAVTNALLYLIHYFGFFVPMIQFGFLIGTFQHNYRHLRAWVPVQVVAGLPLLPWLVATARRDAQNFGIGFLIQPTVTDLPLTFWNLWLGSNNLFWGLIWLFGGLGLLGAGLVFRRYAPHNYKRKQARLLLSLWSFLPPLLVWLISQRRSFYADRYLSLTIPGLMLFLAVAISRIKRQRWRWLAIGVLVALNGVGLIVTQTDPAFQKDDWRGVARYITRHEQADDVILLYSTHIKFPFDYYYNSQLPQEALSLNLENYPIDPLTAGHGRAWVVYPYTRRPTHYPLQPLLPDGFWTSDPDRNPLLVDWLDEHADQVIDYRHFRGVELWLVDLGRT